MPHTAGSTYSARPCALWLGVWLRGRYGRVYGWSQEARNRRGHVDMHSSHHGRHVQRAALRVVVTWWLGVWLGPGSAWSRASVPGAGKKRGAAPAVRCGGPGGEVACKKRIG